MKTIDELWEDGLLCGYCSESRRDYNGNFCEGGSRCKDTYGSYLDECGYTENMISAKNNTKITIVRE